MTSKVEKIKGLEGKVQGLESERVRLEGVIKEMKKQLSAKVKSGVQVETGEIFDDYSDPVSNGDG